MTRALDIVICGLSVTSSWGNGHATTFRALIRGLAALGHRVTFLERDVAWYRDNRDAPSPEGCTVHLYGSLEELEERHTALVRRADAVIVGSYVPEGVNVARWVTSVATGVTAFYDIDTPVTVAKLARGDHEYLSPDVIPLFHLYLSFTGGPMLDHLERTLGARRALPLYCAVDADRYVPTRQVPTWELGYLGTWSADRQPKVDTLLLDVARELPCRAFVVGGPGFTDVEQWPPNVTWRSHVPPNEHPSFYGAQRFTLNVTRSDMVVAGYSPSVRLFEAAACGVPIISDVWPGIDTFFRPGHEILLAETTEDVLRLLADTTDTQRAAIGGAARRRVFASHTATSRAAELAGYVTAARKPGARTVERPLAEGRL